MSQGAIPIVPDWEVQREIVDYGRAGIITTGEPAEIARILEELLDDPGHREALSWSARKRFADVYSPAKVALQLSALFHRVKEAKPQRLTDNAGVPQEGRRCIS